MNKFFKDWFTESRFEIQKNGMVRDSGRRRVSIDDIWTSWMKLKSFRKDSDTWAPVDLDEVEDFIAEERDKLFPEEAEEARLTPRDMLEHFLQKFEELFDIRIVSNRPIVFRRGGLYNEQISLKEAAKETRFEIIMEGVQTLGLDDSTGAAEMFYLSKIRDLREEALEAIRYNPEVKESGFSFKAWTENLFRLYGIENTRLNRVMWRYFVHSIKRAAFGLRPSENRLFFLIYSRTQGIGKSRLLAHLCEPFAHAFNNSATLNELSDKNALKALSKGGYALVDFQELGMGKGSNAVGASDFAALMKRAVTLDVESSRELFTTTDTSSLMNMVFASSTNLHISDVVQETEYRRYFSFNSTLSREESLARDWTEVDKFFSETIQDAYRFLDENTVPELNHDDAMALRDEQLTYRRRTDLVTQWLGECGLEIHDMEDEGSDGCVRIDRGSLYRKFKSFLSSNGYPSFSAGKMQQLIASSLDILAVAGSDGKSYYCVRRTDDAE